MRWPAPRKLRRPCAKLESMTAITDTSSIPALRSHVPAAGRRQPVSTYRLQLGPHFTFADATALLPYLVQLGITDVYCSPILQAAPGSTHGYDVVDHTRISEPMGGRAGFEAFANAAHAAGLGVVVDVVPNHMAMPTPLYLNRAMWSLLRDGPESPYASWFDIDVESSDDGILIPVLGERVGTALAREAITLDHVVVPGYEDDGDVPVLRYYDHVFPVRKGTEFLPLAELLQRQYYRLAYWRVAEEELNYRRFFDVDTLAGIRVEDPEVFHASHALLLELFHAGFIDAFRIDHPDGLADPRQYMERLYEATGGAWIVAEKILEGNEKLPSDWKCAGCTGYEASWRIGALLTDPEGVRSLTANFVHLSHTTQPYPVLEREAKRQIMHSSLQAEVERMARLMAEVCHDDLRLRDHSQRSLHDAVSALVICMDRYRAYVVPGEKPHANAEAALLEAAERARGLLSEDRCETLDVVVDILLGREIGSAAKRHDASRNEAIIRFQQVCGAVMAKGVEDTAFYRYTALTSATEVGSDPRRASLTPDELHTWTRQMMADWPVMMTTLTTHDTKRGEDTRAAIATLADYPTEWIELLERLRERHATSRPAELDGQIENLMWQTIIGTWTDNGPIEADRLIDYLRKAAREQKTWTTWTEPDEAVETGLFAYARSVISTPESVAELTAWWEQTRPARRARILAAKVLALTLIGVPDTYQGEEITRNVLVDPDNRRPVNYRCLAGILTQLDSAGALPARASVDEEKMWVTSRLLRLRRERPDTFVSLRSGYEPLAATTGNIFAFTRTLDGEPDVIVLVSRLAHRQELAGGWGDAHIVLPPGRWRNVLEEGEVEGPQLFVRDACATLPVAVYARCEAEDWGGTGTENGAAEYPETGSEESDD